MLNVCALNGRLTAEPELKHTQSDIPVTSFTLAIDRGYVKAGAERQADFIDIVCWRQTAEFVSKYFHKGQLVAVTGAIQTRSYEDKQGNKRKATEIVASKVDFAERKQDGMKEIAKNAENMGVPMTEANCNDFVEITGEGMPYTKDDDLPF
jgi:single-strand DNA-binding protein